ncbi:MAG: LD-carboxypeptidase [Bacteroidetes bacterium]|nr:LD-carboxypeptidase [Bacteroidota bacterium]
MTTNPAYLQQGDTVGLVCPAGYMAIEKVQTCINTLQEWGYTVKVGNTLGKEAVNYFSGTDEERLADFQQMLDDDTVKAILCARGGYGTSRIIDQLNFKRFRENPKWVIGYSDVTVLLSHIYRNYKITSLHAPMAAAFNDEGYKNEYVLSLKDALEGKKIKYTIDTHELNRKGEAIGELTGGNLSMLTHLIGSSSESKTKGRILFIEDIGEYYYKIDRMLLQLKRAGKLENLAGLIVGGFTDMQDTTLKFGQDVYDLIYDKIKEYDYPVCFNFPVGHQTNNYALKVGAGCKLKVGKNKVVLEE